jgi:Rod binding domain-containing protein
MNIPPMMGPTKPGDLPLEKLAASPALSEDQKLKEASRQFESLLLRQILRDAQKPAFPSKFSDQSVTSTIFKDLLVGELADQISRSGDVGLARTLQVQLQQEYGEKNTEAQDPKNGPKGKS